MKKFLYKNFLTLEEFKDWAGPFIANQRNIKLKVEMTKVSVKSTSLFFIDVETYYIEKVKEV